MDRRQMREHQREEQAEQAGSATDRQWKLELATSHESFAMANPWRHRGDGHQSNAGTHSTNNGKAVVILFENFANTYGTEELLASLALGKVAECPFPSDEVKNLKAEVV